MYVKARLRVNDCPMLFSSCADCIQINSTAYVSNVAGEKRGATRTRTGTAIPGRTTRGSDGVASQSKAFALSRTCNSTVVSQGLPFRSVTWNVPRVPSAQAGWMSMLKPASGSISSVASTDASVFSTPSSIETTRTGNTRGATREALAGGWTAKVSCRAAPGGSTMCSASRLYHVVSRTSTTTRHVAVDVPVLRRLRATGSRDPGATRTDDGIVLSFIICKKMHSLGGQCPILPHVQCLYYSYNALIVQNACS